MPPHNIHGKLTRSRNITRTITAQQFINRNLTYLGDSFKHMRRLNIITLRNKVGKRYIYQLGVQG